MSVQSIGYHTTKEQWSPPSDSNIVYKDLLLDPIEIEEGNDLGKLLSLNAIFFDLNKTNIREDAAIELQKIIAILSKNPEIKIEVRSHTDSQGYAGYNLNLSHRRAQSTIDYLVNQGGIDRSRLTSKGYGETQLINKCANGVRCYEAQHQENRRSEFIIVKQ